MGHPEVISPDESGSRTNEIRRGRRIYPYVKLDVMDYLQFALIFLILLLSIFLSITGIQVFFILRDLKKALDKFNAILQTSENIASDIERPVAAASNLVTGAGATVVSDAAKALGKIIKPKPKRFYKRTL